jgi:MFS family permease
MAAVTVARPDWAARLAARGGFYFGWLVVAVTLITAVVSSGVRMASGVILQPLEAEFGWDRASISLAFAVGLFANGLGAPFGGRLIDRFGPRNVLLGSLVLTLLGTLGTILVPSLVSLMLLWGLVVGLGTGALAGVMGPVVASRWFVARRGLVTGLLGGGTSAGQLIFIPILMTLTITIDWRAGLGLMVAMLGLVVFPLTLALMRDDPASVGLKPYGASNAPGSITSVGGPLTSLSEAARTLDFWLLAGSFFVCGFTSTGLIGTHFIPHAVEHGFSHYLAANALALIGAMNVVGTMASGWLTDRYNPRVLLAIYYGLRATSLVLLPLVSDVVGLMAFAILFGLDYIATVPPTAVLTADRFGKRSLGSIFGWIFFSHQVGSALASYGAGVARFYLGDYQMAFIAAGILGFIAAALCLRIFPVPRAAVAPA